jgi:DNA-binding transcriptional MerR regulator
MRPGEMSVGDLAKEIGVSTATINFYVQEGVIPPPRRLNRTRAAYSARHARLLRLVKNMQASGMTLANVKTLMRQTTDEEGLRKLEDVGMFQAPLTLGMGATIKPVEPFEPMRATEFAARAGVDRAHLRRLESWGILRPERRGRYDVRDLVLVETLKPLLADVPIDDLRFLERLLPVASEAAGVIAKQATIHRDELRTRELRFRELLAPFALVMQYLVSRVYDAENPRWRTEVFKKKR